MDDGDRAKELRDRFDAAALQRQQQAATQAGAPLVIDGRRLCLDCWVEIPAERLNAVSHAVRCAECQQFRERSKRRHP